METILLEESRNPEWLPLIRFRSAFSWRTGIFTELERIRKNAPPDSVIYYRGNDPEDRERESTLAQKEGILAASAAGEDLKGARIIPAPPLFPLLDQIGERLEEDWKQKPFESRASIPDGVSVVGDPDHLRIHPCARILPGSVINTESGPVILDAGCTVSPFSYLEGPLYAGKDSRLDNVRITGGTVLGHQVRVGGEIENCILQDFSNKHHEGFLGHSIIGSWVNLGALSTTSDLKNNYGEVRLEYWKRESTGEKVVVRVPTGRIKFGSLIGDHVKVGIGTMINTGTILDAGSSVFGETPGKYLPPLSWGSEKDIYQVERFLADVRKIMGRRKCEPDPQDESLIRKLHLERISIHAE